MLAVLDVVGAIEGRGYHPQASFEVGFELRGHVLTDVDGGYRVQVADGQARCERAAPAAGAPVIHARGLSLLYAGVQSAANLRFAGLLEGGAPAAGAALDLLFAGRPFHIRNYF
jgi:predicted acetyltransferase